MRVRVQQVVPRIANKALGTAQVREIRARVCAGLTGEVLEIGFGSGLNVPRCPEAVVRVAAVQPRWQHRLEPVDKRIAGGCHLTRPIDELISGAGCTITRLDRAYAAKDPKPFTALYEGLATA